MTDVTLDEFLVALAGMTAGIDEAVKHGLKEAAEIVEAEAKEELGTYQGDAGPTPAWAPLAQATKERRAELGYSEDEPLLRSGELRDRIEHTVEDTYAVVGSNHPGAKAQELGTDKIPQRSFLVGAAYRKEHEVVEKIGSAVIKHIVGK